MKRSFERQNRSCIKHIALAKSLPANVTLLSKTRLECWRSITIRWSLHSLVVKAASSSLNVVDLILTYCFLLLPELLGCRPRNLQISYCQRSCNHCDAGTGNTFLLLSASGCVIHKSKEILLRCLCLFVFAPVLCSSWRWWQSWINDDLVQSTNTTPQLLHLKTNNNLIEILVSVVSITVMSTSLRRLRWVLVPMHSPSAWNLSTLRPLGI